MGVYLEMKKLVKSYLIEIYEVNKEVELDKTEIKEELSKIVKEQKLNLIRKAAKKRQQEIEDYFSGNLPHNKFSK